MNPYPHSNASPRVTAALIALALLALTTAIIWRVARVDPAGPSTSAVSAATAPRADPIIGAADDFARLRAKLLPVLHDWHYRHKQGSMMRVFSARVPP